MKEIKIKRKTSYHLTQEKVMNSYLGLENLTTKLCIKEFVSAKVEFYQFFESFRRRELVTNPHFSLK